MNKKERKQNIAIEMKQLREMIAFYRRNIDDLKEELDYIRGHYDKTWEEVYGSEYAVSVNQEEVKE